MNKKYVVELNDDERERIKQLLHTKETSRGIRNDCLILMLVDESQGAIPKQMEIAQRVGVSDVTIHHTVKSYCTRGLEATLSYRKRPEPGSPASITGELEARIIAWPVRSHLRAMLVGRFCLLTRRVIELNIMEPVGRETIRTTLKKRNLSLT
ncbi:helix-turn-helix domain-containing protein [Paenibacillus graminis]|uniref:helix-turn-helix domain-containing protein n=1 Tax=Paenibacillus graminis TaxID=189425 RepID=UPI002DBC5592|nr:helix-turn-helix domain-containing protein [Paenibacillus graminis]MEC0171903.1 helix-turn-helix domain-containing protein [Paenibacillus graminis]